MVLNKNRVYLAIIFFSIVIIFLDSYNLYSIPLSWIGMSSLLLPPILEIRNTQFKPYLYSLLFFLLATNVKNFQLFYSYGLDYPFEVYSILRYFNLISFFLVVFFAVNFFKSSSNKILSFFKSFIFFYSLLIIYIYFAQIFDLYEPLRNRDNTNLLGESSQSTFWLTQPHRAKGTFREPIFLVAFFYPIVILYFHKTKEKNYLLAILSGIALGLTRSDYLKVFVLILIIFTTVNYFKNNILNIPIVILFFFIFAFSYIGILECNVNQNSNECLDFPEDIEIINSTGEIKLLEGISNDEPFLDRDRNNVINFFFGNINNLKPAGIENVTLEFQKYFASEISEQMYFTNRTLPKYLLTRYNSKNFGTGYYPFLEYRPNVQNLFIFYSIGFGYIFIAFLFLYLMHITLTSKLTFDFLLYIYLISFILMSPIEELNAYYALLVGFGKVILLERKNEKV